MNTTMQQSPSYFKILSDEVDRGLEGKNEGISFGFPRLNNYVNLRKSTLYLFGGFTGSGKTTCADEIFVLNPFEELLRRGKTNKLKIIYWSMERKMAFKFARWFSRKCFLDEGVRIPMERLVGWVNKESRLTKDEHDLFKSYESYFDALRECVTVLDGRRKPTAIRSYTRELMKTLGTVYEIDEYTKGFEPNDSELLVLGIYDHVGKLKKEAKMTSDKDLIDTFSDDISNTDRDLYGISSVIVSQFNRSISNPMRLKQEDVSPMVEDFKMTSDMAEDADVVMSIFDPWRYKVDDPSGYRLDELRDVEGNKYYRNLQILKNSFGREDIRIGLAYEPEMGVFREMKKRELMTEYDYAEIRNGKYFLH